MSATHHAPTYVPLSEDPGANRHDGSRAIEVTAMFGDSVLGVRHLDNPAGGRISVLTLASIVLGWGVFAAGGVLAVVGQFGLGAMLLVSGLGFGVVGLLRRAEETGSPHYTVGEAPGADVNLRSPAVPLPAFPIVQSSGADYHINFTAGMGGEVSSASGGVTTLAELRASGRAAPAPTIPGAFCAPVPHDARIALELGEATFLVRSVQPAREVRGGLLGATDWRAQSFNGASLAAHVLVLAMVFSMPPGGGAGLGSIETRTRVVGARMKLQQLEEDLVPAWLKKQVEEEHGKVGQAHRGTEGKAGKRTAKARDKKFGIKGDSPDIKLARRLAEESARSTGLLKLLGDKQRGGPLASIFSRDVGALGHDSIDAMGNLIGNGVGESYGLGGLGIAGTGRGGGGLGDGTVGTCNSPNCAGQIGRAVRQGVYVRARTVKPRLRDHKTTGPKVRPGPATAEGGLDKELIRRTIRRHLNEVRYCYQRELQVDPNLSGRVVVHFTISATGRVVLSRVKSSTVARASVGHCISRAVRRWSFPKPAQPSITIVTYPFLLRAAASAAR